MRKILSVLLSVIAVFTMCSCAMVSSTAPGTEYGSFTIKKTSSYDGKYYAYMTQHAVGTVIANEATVTWTTHAENDSYNLWVQSGDLGILCYTMSDEVWTLDDSAVRPDYILSKYDDMDT